MTSIPEAAWFLRGDRGLTYSRDVPEGSRVVDGRWWPANYQGPPLVSLDVEAARAAGLKVGDSMTVSILGREIEATIASLREINWDTMGFNFVIVFSPGVLESAPHSFMATISMPEARGAPVRAGRLRAFPTVSAIRVKEVVDAVSACSASFPSRPLGGFRRDPRRASPCWSARSPRPAAPASMTA
jgi:putative ABC transport system permease protein